MKMKKSLLAVAAAATCFGFTNSAFSEPTCKMSIDGSKVSVTISDTGIVWNSKQKPSQGWVTYPGTGTPGDVAASCSDNKERCVAIKWYLRFADSVQGWPSDSVIESDKRVVPCTYRDLGLTCAYTFVNGMRKVNNGVVSNEVVMHYSAKVDGQVVAAYQPQGGDCGTRTDNAGGYTLTVIKQPD